MLKEVTKNEAIIGIKESWDKVIFDKENISLGRNAFFLDFLNDLNPNYSKRHFFSIDKERVIGYFLAVVCNETKNVEEIYVFNFSKNSRFGIDFYSFIKTLQRTYRMVRWTAIEGHSAEKTYERILKKFNGRVVGVLKNKIKLCNGKIYDERIYEIDNINRIHAAKKERSIS